MFIDNNFLGQKVSFGICQGVVLSHDKIYYLDPSKKHWALANLCTNAKVLFTDLNSGIALAIVPLKFWSQFVPIYSQNLRQSNIFFFEKIV